MRNKNFCFEFLQFDTPEKVNDGWGRGIFYVNNSPLWYTNSIEDPKPVDWTWVDFLYHIATIWPSLLFEQSYPYPWLENIPVNIPIASIYDIADKRWNGMTDEASIDEESSVIHNFLERHNLAAGWIGMAAPALLWMRSGDSVWLCPEDHKIIRASFKECVAELIRVCDQISHSFHASTNSRVINAIHAWDKAKICTAETVIRNQGGFFPKIAKVIQGTQSNSDFWEISENINTIHAANDNHILAAARMVASISHDPQTIKNIVANIKKYPQTAGASLALQKFSTDIKRDLKKNNFNYSYSNGYALAEWVRKKWVKNTCTFIDIEHLLKSLSVITHSTFFGIKEIEAIAIWGNRGPLIMLNSDREFTDPNRTRITLAHELCHLLIDREGALPVIDVLGGHFDNFIEQRANAFAAELLLPRSQIERIWASKVKSSLTDIVNEATHEFKVSKSVAHAQIFNSSIMSKLSFDEQSFLRLRIANNKVDLYETSITSLIL